MIVSIHKMILHDYTKLLNMILHPPFHDLKFLIFRSLTLSYRFNLSLTPLSSAL